MVLNHPRNSTNYNIAGTDTFRLGSRMLTIKLTRPKREGQVGSNLQNIEKGMRHIYIPDDGYIFTQVDQSGAEALIVAYLCKHGNFRDLFLNAVKPHCYVALHVFSSVWQKELEHTGVNIRELVDSPINALTSNPHWRAVDKVIKKSDENPPERRYYYISKQICHASVDSLTEVLTPNGWIKVSHITDDKSIMIYDKESKKLSFEQPSNWSRYSNSSDSLIRIKAPYVDQFVTHNHRVLFADNGREQIRFAEQLLGNKTIKIPFTGTYSGDVKISNEVLRLCAAIQADGSLRIKNNYVIFHLKKKRKAQRIKDILIRLGITYKYKLINRLEGLSHRFLFYLPQSIKQLNFIDWNTKTFNFNLLSLCFENLNCLMEELQHWDGSSSSNRIRYFSSNLDNINLFHTIAHITNRRASIVDWPSNSKLPCKCLTYYKMGYYRYSKLTERIVKEPYPLKDVYCPTVSTGFFLIRRYGKISITGNSNYGMKSGMFQLNTLEKSKGKIVISKEEAERYLSTYHSLFPEIHHWHRVVEDQLHKTRTLYNLFGHPRMFWYPSVEPPMDILKKAYAFVPQSTVAMITRLAYTDMQNYIEDNNLDWHLMADTHDSYMVMSPIGTERDVASVMQRFINRQLTGPDSSVFYMKSEAQSGYNWSPAKKGINENGLKEILV